MSEKQPFLMKILKPLVPALLCLCLAAHAHGAAGTPNPGLKYYYPAPEAPVVDVEADVVVYGGTSGGVVAAVQAARQGNSVVLVVFGRHLGGMTSGGLTSTDGVNAKVQGGLTREYFAMTGRRGFKPSTAEAAFEALLADPVPGSDRDEAIPAYYEQRLDAVEKDGARILALHMENGSVFRGRMFIDCTYEGDLMAKADVPYTYGRESKSCYNESRAGRHASVALPGVDPYIVEGDPESGLIYNLMPDEVEGPVGSGDDHVQAYNFRMYTVQNSDPSKLQPLFKPAGYDASIFEILYRYHKSGGNTSMQVGNDINNHELFNRGVATDHIGGNRWSYDDGETWIAWADADYATRELMYQSHVNWQLGMLWYLQNDPRYAALVNDASLPQARRDKIAALIAKMQELGLPKGEYPETGGWTHELYIREARRMVSDFVVTQAHYDRLLPVPDSVGLANYRADAHHSRRFVSESGSVRVEGDTGGNAHTPWQIPLRALLPPEEDASNLLVPWAISASHVAFCSMRMEPCFMALSQSAAIAAGLAIEKEQSVQQIDYESLRPLLLEAGQILGEPPVEGLFEIVDNEESDQVELVGEWLSGNRMGGYYGLNYLHDNNTGGGKSVTYRPDLPEAGVYEVYLRWTSNENRATNARVEVVHTGGADATTVNQQINGGSWQSIGKYKFAAGTAGTVTLSNKDANGYVIADAVRFVKQADAPASKP